MNRTEFEPAPDNYSELLQGMLHDLQEHTRAIKSHDQARIRTYGRVTDVIRRYGVTQETKFLRAAFRQNPTDEVKTGNFLRYISELDEMIKTFSGQMTMWVTSKEDTISHPFNPAVRPETEKKYILHMGLLPENASIEVGSRGDITVPIARAVSGPIIGIYMSEKETKAMGAEELAPFEQIVPAKVFDGEWARVSQPASIDLSFWNFENPVPAIFGDSNVKSFFEQHRLGDYPEIAESLDTLTSTLF